MPIKDKEKKIAYSKEWYKKNKDTSKEKIKQRGQSILSWFQEYKSTLSCEKCGENHPACLSFHHVDPTKKVKTITRMVQDAHAIENILEEISKCIVLCENCHRKLHWNEKHNISL